MKSLFGASIPCIVGFTVLVAWASSSGDTLAATAAAARCTLDAATGTTIDRTPLTTNGWAVRWNAATNRIAYMEPDPVTGYYRVYTARPDNGDRFALTGGRPGIPAKHQGSPYWHPSGRYLLFTAEKQEWSSPRLFGDPDYEALPGFGLHSDIWLITSDGTRSWQLTHDPNTKDQGVLVPVFSADGKRIAWSSRQPSSPGHRLVYAIEVADFVEKPQPHLENVKSYQPGGEAYYETGSFTSDGRSLMYTSDQDTHNFWASQIYRLDLATGQGTRLTQGNFYNEHPVVAKTPSGDWVVYMSAKGVDRFPFHLMMGTDWYAMRPDGSGAKRLTEMNVNRPDNPENFGYPQVAVLSAVSPSGDSMLGDVQRNLAKQTGFIRVVHFTCGAPTR
jgi:hypothetical protein